MQKIKSLTVSNYKGIDGVITIEPKGSLVVIAGRNGAGKSSFIDGITELFDPSGTKLTPRPIHDGAEGETYAECVTDQARIRRTWKKNDAGTLTVKALDGAKYPSGREFVLKATGGALFDPYEFVGMGEKDQRDALLARVELPFSLDDKDRERAGYFTARTGVSGELKKVQARLVAMPVDPDAPAAEVSAAEVLAEDERAREANELHARLQAQQVAADQHLAMVQASRQALEESLAAALTEEENAHEASLEARDAAAAHPETVDRGAIMQKLATIEETNARVRAAEARARVAAEAAELEAREQALTDSIAAVDREKKKALADAEFPVAGLGVDDDGITFAGVPFKQVNTAQKTAIALELATLSQPDLRLVVIRDGDLLDAETLAQVDRVATARGYLVMTERDRDESREVGFTISGGKLA